MDMGKAPRLAGTAWVLSLASFLLVSATAAAPPGLLERYGDGGRHFAEVEIGYMLVYYHQRALGQATVEKDYIVYQLDRETGKLLARKSHWRDDLPATMTDLRVSRDQAEAIVEGEVDFSNLYIISPESDVFPLDPTPRNPCWAVRSVGERGEYVVTVIDAVTGLVLGEGVPPPYTAFSLTGPQYDGPCSGAWDAWSEQAAYWFDQMGYSTEVVEWPTESKVRSHIQSDTTAMFYELAHGGSYNFASGCSGGSSYEFTYSSEIQTWIMDYEKMPFAFIGSCDGMCYTNNGTFAYVFRKGSSVGATVVGYCGMSEPQCADCWAYSRNWQGVLFNYMDQGYTVKDAFDQADADYPVCATPNCTRFAGDEDFTVVPIVYRVPDTDPGDCNHDFQVNLSDWAQFSGCLSGPVAPYVGDCECADFDGDTDADLADFAQYQTTYVYPLPPVVFVDASATGGNNGSSWTDAFTELQAALDVAVEGDEVWVAAGRYTPDYDVGTGVHTGSRDAAFLATAGVGIYGGFAGGEVYKHHRDLAANATILSGDLAGNDGPGFANNGENSYHVVAATSGGAGTSAVLDGFTIASGNADGTFPANTGGV